MKWYKCYCKPHVHIPEIICHEDPNLEIHSSHNVHALRNFSLFTLVSEQKCDVLSIRVSGQSGSVLGTG